MRLFSSDDQYSHRVRIALREKGVRIELVNINQLDEPEKMLLLDLGPSDNKPPILEDRDDVVLTQAAIILEYLEERFPYPPLMPITPIERAKCRQVAYRLEQEICQPAELILSSTGKKVMKSAVETLSNNLTFVVSILRDRQSDWFMGKEFSILDCILGPVLWRLPQLKIEISGKRFAPLNNYMKRLFSRDAFKYTLTDAERDIRIRFDSA